MTEALPLAAVIGFAGSVPNGLIAHPDGETVVYPLGSTIVLRSRTSSEKQEFLRGHSHEVRGRPPLAVVTQSGSNHNFAHPSHFAAPRRAAALHAVQSSNSDTAVFGLLR